MLIRLIQRIREIVIVSSLITYVKIWGFYTFLPFENKYEGCTCMLITYKITISGFIVLPTKAKYAKSNRYDTVKGFNFEVLKFRGFLDGDLSRLF